MNANLAEQHTSHARSYWQLLWCLCIFLSYQCQHPFILLLHIYDNDEAVSPQCQYQTPWQWYCCPHHCRILPSRVGKLLYPLLGDSLSMHQQNLWRPNRPARENDDRYHHDQHTSLVHQLRQRTLAFPILWQEKTASCIWRKQILRHSLLWACYFVHCVLSSSATPFKIFYWWCLVSVKHDVNSPGTQWDLYEKHSCKSPVCTRQVGWHRM